MDVWNLFSIWCLGFGAWDLVLFLAMLYALCSMLSRDGDSVRRDRPSRRPLDGLRRVGSPHTDSHIHCIQIPGWSRICEVGQTP